MRKLLSVCLLMLCLSLPAIAGHSVIGGSWCAPCGAVGCLCDPGEEPQGQGSRFVSDESSQDTPVDLGSEALLVLALLLIALRYKD
jgi:hypothetical protein